jgi:hypothetical protein
VCGRLIDAAQILESIIWYFGDFLALESLWIPSFLSLLGVSPALEDADGACLPAMSLEQS